MAARSTLHPSPPRARAPRSHGLMRRTTATVRARESGHRSPTTAKLGTPAQTASARPRRSRSRSSATAASRSSTRTSTLTPRRRGLRSPSGWSPLMASTVSRLRTTTTTGPAPALPSASPPPVPPRARTTAALMTSRAPLSPASPSTPHIPSVLAATAQRRCEKRHLFF